MRCRQARRSGSRTDTLSIKIMTNQIPPLDEAALLRLKELSKDHPEIKNLLEQTESLRAELLAKATEVEIKPPATGKAE